MATELDKLVVKIEADLGDLKKGMEKANRTVKDGSKGISSSTKKMANDFANLGGKVAKFGTLLAGAFSVYQIKKVIDVGIQIESLQIRLNALFGSVEEGSKAFLVMTRYASRVPFTLGQIQEASGNLAVVADDANELAEVLEITGNVASATGLSFEQTATQIQRSFSGGIASADIFRERGVRAMLGFEAGVEVTLAQTIKAFKEKFGEGGEFGNVTANLANTLQGTLSMLEDKLLQFRMAISETFFVTLKKELKSFDENLNKSSEAITRFGNEVGKRLASAVTSIVNNIDELILALKTLGTVLEASVIFFLGRMIIQLNKAKLIFVGLTGTIALLHEAFDGETDAVKRGIVAKERLETINRAVFGDYKKGNNLIRMSTEELLKNAETSRRWNLIQKSIGQTAKETPEQMIVMLATYEEIKEITKETTKTFEDMGTEISDAFGEAVVSGSSFRDAMRGIMVSVAQQIVSTVTEILIMRPIIQSLTKDLEDYAEAQKKAGGIGSSILGQLVNIGVSAFAGNLFGSATAVTPEGMTVGSDLLNAKGQVIGTQQQPMQYSNFATGGYVAPNVPVMVGERGAEMFMPTGGGHIIPNNQMGGQGVTINQHLNFSTGVVPTVRAEIMNLMPQIKEETVTAVAEARTRGGAFSRAFGA